jgi:hypothetical protein
MLGITKVKTSKKSFEDGISEHSSEAGTSESMSGRSEKTTPQLVSPE